MAFVTVNDVRRFEASLLDRVKSVIASMQEAKLRREIYNRTVNELAVLSERDLADLGIARCDITALARKHAYDL